MTGKEIIEAIQQLPEEQQNWQFCYPFDKAICSIDQMQIMTKPYICTADGPASPDAVILVS